MSLLRSTSVERPRSTFIYNYGSGWEVRQNFGFLNWNTVVLTTSGTWGEKELGDIVELELWKGLSISGIETISGRPLPIYYWKRLYFFQDPATVNKASAWDTKVHITYHKTLWGGLMI